ncbi:MAG: hypothetical protein J0H99_06505, partial [Rhodospirillales bacterium]|nr:hypothetical protein [Rhodospirillales bacterium]
MAVRSTIVGAKSTRRRQYVLGGSASDIRDTLKAATSQSSFEGWVQEVEARALSVLQSRGPQLSYEDERDQTSAYYAQRILLYLKRIRAAIDRRDAAEAAFLSTLLGALVREHDMKLDADWRHDQC